MTCDRREMWGTLADHGPGRDNGEAAATGRGSLAQRLPLTGRKVGKVRVSQT